MASSSSRRPHSTPTPVGPQHLVAGEGEEVGTEFGDTSVGRWGTYWHASTQTSAPAACAASAICRIGVIVPSTFDMAEMAQQLRAVEQHVEVAEVERPSGRRGSSAARCPRSAADLPRHDVGVVLHLVSTTASPSARFAATPRPGHQVERSVAFFVNTISSGRWGADEAGHRRRAFSMAFVDASASAYTPRCDVGVGGLVVVAHARR
jgi:hypothetical protein